MNVVGVLAFAQTLKRSMPQFAVVGLFSEGDQSGLTVCLLEGADDRIGEALEPYQAITVW